MKTIIYILIAATLVIGTAPEAFAQDNAKTEKLSKAEKKAQKLAEKERKKLEKEKAKQEKANKKSKSSSTSAPKGKKATAALTELLQNNNDSLRTVIAQMEAQKRLAAEEKAIADQEIAELKGQMDDSLGMVGPEAMMFQTPDGLTFKVQLGSYIKFNSSTFMGEMKTLSMEKTGSQSKYLIGFFDSFENAKACEQNFKRLGIRDAWLVPYLNGKRVSDEQAEEILGRKIRDL